MKQLFIPQDELEAFGKLGKDAQRLFLADEYKFKFDFLVDLLGYHDLGAFHNDQINRIAEFKIITDTPVRRLWLWARGHFKTSLIAEAHSIDLIINNPNIRILVVSNTLGIATTILKNVKSQFTSNNEFRYFFKEFCPKVNKEGKVEFGTTEAFTVPNRTKVLKEPTMMCAGIGTNLTGLHFDVMIIDDLVTKDSVSNDTQILASKEYYSSLRSLFDNPTCPREEVIGTTYHFNDLYSDLKKNRDFKISFIPAIIDEVITFPERFSKEGLEQILSDPTIGPHSYNAQYLLNPINPKDAKFQDSWLKYYQGNELPWGLTEFICVDPASTQKKKSDYTVIEHWGVDHELNCYLINAVRDRMTVFQRIDKVVEFTKNTKRLAWVKYEALGGRHGDLEQLRQRFVEEKMYIVPQETRATNASKKDRVEQRLVGQFYAGKIKLPYFLNYIDTEGKIHDFIQEFKVEYLQFPFTEHDDILDCASFLFEEQLPRGEKPFVKSQEIKPMTADEEEAYYQQMKRMRGTMGEEHFKNRLFGRKVKRIIQGAYNGKS